VSVPDYACAFFGNNAAASNIVECTIRAGCAFYQQKDKTGRVIGCQQMDDCPAFASASDCTSTGWCAWTSGRCASKSSVKPPPLTTPSTTLAPTSTASPVSVATSSPVTLAPSSPW